MSIKEALERSAPPPQQEARGEWNELSKIVRRKRYEYAFSFLEKSGGLKLLRELAPIIKTDFTDVALIRHNHPTTGEVSLALEWNYKKQDEPASPFSNCNRLSVHAFPLGGFISVESNDLFTVLSESEWSSSQEHLENAIVHAYRESRTTWFSILDFHKDAKILPLDPKE